MPASKSTLKADSMPDPSLLDVRLRCLLAATTYFQGRVVSPNKIIQLTRLLEEFTWLQV